MLHCNLIFSSTVIFFTVEWKTYAKIVFRNVRISKCLRADGDKRQIIIRNVSETSKLWSHLSRSLIRRRHDSSDKSLLWDVSRKNRRKIKQYERNLYNRFMVGSLRFQSPLWKATINIVQFSAVKKRVNVLLTFIDSINVRPHYSIRKPSIQVKGSDSCSDCIPKQTGKLTLKFCGKLTKKASRLAMQKKSFKSTKRRRRYFPFTPRKVYTIAVKFALNKSL